MRCARSLSIRRTSDGRLRPPWCCKIRPTLVQLRYATLPTPLGAIAVHHWFVVFDDAGGAQRWEVWQTRNAGGTCVGYVHRDLKHPDAGVGGGPFRIAAEWTG